MEKMKQVVLNHSLVNNTIFPILSLDRKDVHWEDHYYDLTPVEQVDNLLFKREDYFAPLGYGGINGSKLRQCIWLTDEYVKNDNKHCGVLSGTSVKSPQLPMGSAVATHFGLRSCHVIGATKASIAIKHPNVAMATWFGADFFVNPHIAYNPVLQRKVKEIKEKKLHDYFYLEYGITVDHRLNSKERVEAFHRLGSEQVKNIPDHIETLILPAGSCNSCTSILYGLARFQPKNIKDVHLIGIGPNKIDFIEQRLDIIEKVSGVYIKGFKRNYTDSPLIQTAWDIDSKAGEFFYGKNTGHSFNLHHYDLHTTGYVNYQDVVPYNFHGIDLHPTYEGKVMKYVKEKLPHLINDKSLFWIVGSEPKKEVMYDLLKNQLGEYPTSIKEFTL